MGMTIDEAIDFLGESKYSYESPSSDTLDVAIDTMRKYQKIQEIINNAKDSDGAVKYNWLYEQIGEVVEDGDDDNGKQASVIQEVKQKVLVEACDSFKKDYENHLKAAMTAMLTELKNKLIDKSWNIDMYDDDLDFECCYLTDIDEVIQQKINVLQGEE